MSNGRTASAVLLGLASLLLFSCELPSRVVYVLPEDAQGKECAVRCAYTRSDCYRKCQKELGKCEEKESRTQAVSEYISKVLDVFSNNSSVDGGASATKRTDVCESKKSECISRCTDEVCTSRCEVKFSCQSKSLGGAFRFGIDKDALGGRKKLQKCSSRRCDSLCESDYNACFAGCGGKAYLEASGSKGAAKSKGN